MSHFSTRFLIFAFTYSSVMLYLYADLSFSHSIFLLPKEISFNISWNVGLLATNYLTFCLKKSYFSSLLKENFWWYMTQIGVLFFSFFYQHFKCAPYSSLAWFLKRNDLIRVFHPLQVKWVFCLFVFCFCSASSWIFSLFLILCSLKIICLVDVLFIPFSPFILFGDLELSGSEAWCLTLIWGNSQSLLFQIFLLCFFILLLVFPLHAYFAFHSCL